MSLINLLKTGILISCIILTVLAFWVYSIYKNYEDTNNNVLLSQSISNTTSKLNSLTTDYLIYHRIRASQQWKANHQKLSAYLSSQNINNLNRFTDINSLTKAHKRTLNLFNRLVNIHKLTTGHKSSQIYIHQQRALASQLLSSIQVISSLTRKLTEAINKERGNIKKELLWVALSILVILLSTMLILWLLIALRIVTPIRKLKKHIEQIHASNLDEIYFKTRPDEIGDLAISFNKMTSDLKETTVSKQKLLNEVNERKRTELELREQQRFNNSVLEGAGNVITILDKNGNFVKFNHSAEKLTGYNRDELIGKPVWDNIIPPEERELTKKVFDNLISDNIEPAKSHENHWLKKNGEYCLLEWHNTVLRDANNDITHVIAIGYDISQKKLNERENKRLERELNQARKMEALGQFTGGVAHDFNNMLAIILGYTDLANSAVSDLPDSKLNDYLTQIQSASTRAKNLVAQMLAFSRNTPSESQPIQIAPLLDENLIMLKSIIPSSIKIHLNVEDNLPDVVMDPVKLQQIIMNLIINSKDAMRDNGNITMTLGWKKSVHQECSSCHQLVIGDWIELSFADDGKGMDAHVLERIFEPFYTTKGPSEGTGMGMSVLHGIIKSHDGHIFVASTPGVGTCIQILFPPASTTTDINKNTDSTEKTINTAGNGQRILIIDDQEALALFEENLLNEYNYQCTVKSSSKEAINLFINNPDSFDLIITDQTMPDFTGLEVIEKARSVRADIPVILTTGYSTKIDSQELLKDNVALIYKPFTTASFLSSIAGLLDNNNP